MKRSKFENADKRGTKREEREIFEYLKFKKNQKLSNDEEEQYLRNHIIIIIIFFGFFF